MLRALRHHLSYANVTATLALVLSMGGAAWAAGHYVIKSPTQISPKVLRTLKGHKGVAGAPGPEGPQGPTGPAGAAGAQGVQGQAGATGPQGPTGATGTTGPTGPTGAEGAIGTSQNGAVFARSLEPTEPNRAETELTELRGSVKLRLACGPGRREGTTAAVLEASAPSGSSAETGILANTSGGGLPEETEHLVDNVELTEGFTPIAELSDDAEYAGTERRPIFERIIQGQLTGTISSPVQADFLDVYIEVSPYGTVPVCLARGAAYGSPLA